MNRLQLPSKVAEQTWPSESLCSWAQGLVEAGLASWSDRQADLLAKAHQESVNLTPQVPVGVRMSKCRGAEGRREGGSPSCPCCSTWAATPPGLHGSPLGTWSSSWSTRVGWQFCARVCPLLLADRAGRTWGTLADQPFLAHGPTFSPGWWGVLSLPGLSHGASEEGPELHSTGHRHDSGSPGHPHYWAGATARTQRTSFGVQGAVPSGPATGCGCQHEAIACRGSTCKGQGGKCSQASCGCHLPGPWRQLCSLSPRGPAQGPTTPHVLWADPGGQLLPLLFGQSSEVKCLAQGHPGEVAELGSAFSSRWLLRKPLGGKSYSP